MMHPLQTAYAEARAAYESAHYEAVYCADKPEIPSADADALGEALREAEDAMCLGVHEIVLTTATGQAAMLKRVILATGVEPAQLLANPRTREKFVEMCFRVEVAG